MREEILTRMGDGQWVRMSPAQVKEEIAAGAEDAADRGKIPGLTSAEKERLFEIIAPEDRVVGVRPGEEVVLTDDVSYIRMHQDEGASGGLSKPGRCPGFFLSAVSPMPGALSAGPRGKGLAVTMRS